MLTLKDSEKSPLPKKYRSINNLCAVIYDQFTSVVSDSHFLKHYTVEFPIDPANQKFVSEFNAGDVHALDFLKENGLNGELTEILTKHIYFSIIADFANFMYESLSCAQRGKMAVAYALLRKPLTDELLILEQLLTDSTNFIDLYFHLGDPKLYDPSRANLDRRQIIQNVFKKSRPLSAFDSDTVFALRYDKEAATGINGITNHALHIVTNHKAYPTDNQSFNFIFSVKEDYKRYWEHYYQFVPYLLIYAAHVVDELVFSWMPEYSALKTVRSFQRLIGILNLVYPKNLKKNREKLAKDLNAIATELNGPCEQCGSLNTFQEADFVLFFNQQLLLCPYCFHNHLFSSSFLDRIDLILDTVHGKR
ncbi:hypothetical protein [Fibrivirga algicola]|uniref:Uncharacterized protein n=1 Tax=Fibrivirga algicola TaxID=2950420 RepID=A0ABX0QFJ8_9BACT|nr:hypothetical protein [Fibrivirga algicola]NID08834.1 hypothetical protein [Fibrivirga algicola]